MSTASPEYDLIVRAWAPSPSLRIAAAHTVPRPIYWVESECESFLKVLCPMYESHRSQSGSKPGTGSGSVLASVEAYETLKKKATEAAAAPTVRNRLFRLPFCMVASADLGTFAPCGHEFAWSGAWQKCNPFRTTPQNPRTGSSVWAFSGISDLLAGLSELDQLILHSEDWAATTVADVQL